MEVVVWASGGEVDVSLHALGLFCQIDKDGSKKRPPLVDLPPISLDKNILFDPAERIRPNYISRRFLAVEHAPNALFTDYEGTIAASLNC
jgi:hypothetical protein